MKQEEDEEVLEGLFRKRGSEWVVARLLEHGGRQLVLLHLANSLLDDPRTEEEAVRIFELITRLDEQNGWPGSLDCTLGDLHAFGFPYEPKPQVIRAFDLDFGEDTDVVLDACRNKGYATSGTEVQVPYCAGADPYIGTEAADLEEEIGSIVKKHLRLDLSLDERTQRIVPVFGSWAERLAPWKLPTRLRPADHGERSESTQEDQAAPEIND